MTALGSARPDLLERLERNRYVTGEATLDASRIPPPPRRRSAIGELAKASPYRKPAADGCFAKIGSAVYRDRALNNTAGRLVALLSSLAGRKGWCECRVGWLAAAMEVDPRTVRRATARAEALELIAFELGRGRGHRNRYTMLPAALPPPIDPNGGPRRRVAQQNKADKNVRVTPSSESSPRGEASSASPPYPLPEGEGGLDGAASRGAEAAPPPDPLPEAGEGGRLAQRPSPIAPLWPSGTIEPPAPQGEHAVSARLDSS